MSPLLQTIEKETGANPSVAIIWMHGLGADANDFVPLIPELDLAGLPAIRFIFPNAETMPVTINGGYVMRAWYDIAVTDLGRQEDEAGLRASQLKVEALIARENARGIPNERIILAGFSQGCAMTLQTGLRQKAPLAGLMCLSGYVPIAAKAAEEHTPESKQTPIFLVHGRMDPVIPLARATASRDLLTGWGYQVEWHEYAMQHSVCPEEVQHISAWLKKIL
jgi:phospholipase/carboxylesterase